jgi:hypothetical protein
MFGVGLRLPPSVRAGLERRSGGACEGCGLEWRWALYVFKRDPDQPATTANLAVLCGACSAEREDGFAHYVGGRTVRDRMRTANNRRTGAEPLTDSRRRALIRARGSACEICGVTAEERVLQVHHRIAVLRGGDDSPENLQVLCFACHHVLQPCRTGCGAWASKRRGICQNCLTRAQLERLLPDATWEEIKARYPSFVAQWKPGYEPLALEARS